MVQIWSKEMEIIFIRLEVTSVMTLCDGIKPLGKLLLWLKHQWGSIMMLLWSTSKIRIEFI